MSDDERYCALPILNLLLAREDPTLFREQLRDACHNTGFFLLRHNIPIAKQMLDEAGQFFDRSLEEKMQISYDKSRNFRGYMPMGVENTGGVVDLREQIELATEENPLVSDWPPYERLRGTNPWPAAVQPSLQITTLAYLSQVEPIANLIRGVLCSLLGLSDETEEGLFGSGNGQGEKPHWALKLVCYPPIQKLEQSRHSTASGTTFGVGPHTDTNFLTIVLQDTLGGLQVLSQGTWIDVPSEEGVLVCNLGEQAELLSRGYFRATPHRVLPNSQLKHRISVPFFFNPLLSANIVPQPLPGDLKWESLRESDGVDWRPSYNKLLTAVGDNTFKSLARSHPLVFQRNHSDLVVQLDGSVVQRPEVRATNRS